MKANNHEIVGSALDLVKRGKINRDEAAALILDNVQRPRVVAKAQKDAQPVRIPTESLVHNKTDYARYANFMNEQERLHDARLRKQVIAHLRACSSYRPQQGCDHIQILDGHIQYPTDADGYMLPIPTAEGEDNE